MFANFVYTGESMMKQSYVNFVKTPKTSGVDMVSKFIDFLRQNNSGLQVFCCPNSRFGKEEWDNQWKAIDMNATDKNQGLTSKCNQ